MNELVAAAPVTTSPLREWIARIHRRVHVARTFHALPFAALGAVAARRTWPTLGEMCLLAGCVVFGRALSVSSTKFFGAPEDVANPNGDESAASESTVPRPMWAAFAVHAAIMLVFLAWLLNPVAGVLAAALAFVLATAAALRRRTALSHFMLGFGLGSAPVGAWIALTGVIDESLIGPLILGVGVLLWAAGYDILYSLQPRLRDVSRADAFSARMALSPPAARHAAKACQAIAVGLFFAAAEPLRFAPAYYVGPAGAMAAMLVSHIRVYRAPADTGDRFFRFWNLLTGPFLLVGAILGA